MARTLDPLDSWTYVSLFVPTKDQTAKLRRWHDLGIFQLKVSHFPAPRPIDHHIEAYSDGLWTDRRTGGQGAFTRQSANCR